MTNYARMYRLGFTPWERYRETATQSIATLLDREEAKRSHPLGRALDLGCGRGQYTQELARRGWDAVGMDYVQDAIETARTRDTEGAMYVVGDVTDLQHDLGMFDFFLDIGCFQGFEVEQALATGHSITKLARPGATMLQLSFGPSRWLIGGVSQADVTTAFPAWDLLTVDSADTAGLGWPMSKTSPKWYRLRLRS